MRMPFSHFKGLGSTEKLREPKPILIKTSMKNKTEKA